MFFLLRRMLVIGCLAAVLAGATTWVLSVQENGSESVTPSYSFSNDPTESQPSVSETPATSDMAIDLNINSANISDADTSQKQITGDNNLPDNLHPPLQLDRHIPCETASNINDIDPNAFPQPSPLSRVSRTKAKEGMSVDDDMSSALVEEETSPLLLEDKLWTKAIYDATLTKPQPEWGVHNIPRMKVVYPYELGINIKHHAEILPADAYLKYMVHNLPNANIYCIDIEQLEVCVSDDVKSERNTAELLRVVEAFRAMRPNSKIGFWGILPRGNYVAGRTAGTQRTDAIKNNLRGRALANEIDIIFPALYRVKKNDMTEPSDAEWKLRADFLINESRKYDKPVYGFIRPLRENDEFQNWPLQLRYVYNHADAVVIWSHPFEWTIKDRWWNQTINFLDQIRATGTASCD